MSPEARASEYVTYEWAFAWGLGIKVIPVLYKDTKLHPRLEALQYLNFTSRTARPRDALIDVIKNATHTRSSSPTTNVQTMPSYLRQSIEALDSSVAVDRKNAIENLTKIDHELARQTLKEALHHPLGDVRFYAALVQVQFNDTLVLPVLLEALKDENISTNEIVKPLTIVGKVTVPSLVEVLNGDNTRAKYRAIEALGQLGDARAVPDLLKALLDKPEAVRANAARALGQIGDARAVPSLLEALKDKKEDVRVEAAKAPGKIGDTRAILGLLEALHDQEDKVNNAAARALGQLGDTSIVPDLLEYLRRNYLFLNGAIEALGQLGDARAVPGLLETAHKTSYKEYSQLAFKAIEGIGETAIPYLAEALHSESLNKKGGYQQDEIIEVMGNIGTAEVVPILMENLKNERPYIRSTCAKYLGQIGDARAVPDLLKALHEKTNSAQSSSRQFIANSQTEYVRSSAAKALGQIGDARAIPDLCEALNDDAKFVRSNAADALGQLGDARAVPCLIEALSDKESTVRNSAAKALVKLGEATIHGFSEVASVR